MNEDVLYIVGRHCQVANRHAICSIPTLALFAGGSELARQSGALTSPAQIVQWVRARLQG